jgi:hypothetical protein
VQVPPAASQPPAMHPWVHAPFEHVPTQVVEVPHWPVASQVCAPLPEQRVVPGTQTPVQAPAAHAKVQG